MRDNLRAGFSLIEILVVISMISILLSVVAFSGNDARSTAKVTVADQDVQQIRLALQLYLETNGELPSESARSDWVAAADELHPDYLSQEIVNDPWGNMYVYRNNYGGGLSGSGSLICSAGPDETFVSDSSLASYEASGDDICQFIFDED